MIKIISKNFKKTKAMEEVLTSKLKQLEKYDENLEIKLYLDVLSDVQHRAYAICKFKGAVIKGDVISEYGMYPAVDLLINDIKSKISLIEKKYKKRQRGMIKEMRAVELMEEEIEEGKIKKRKFFNLKPMYENEAIEQMNLLNHNFFVFNSFITEGLQVIYKRKNKGYGSITFDKGYSTHKDYLGKSDEIVKRKLFDLEKMTEKEAIEKIEELRHDFFIFANSEYESITVLYKRNKKGYGLIDTQFSL